MSDIDPDIHYDNDEQYYNENSFNKVFKDCNELLLIHLNIRSVPAHFSLLKAQFDCLSLKFKLINFYETAINNCHTCFKNPGYVLEQDFRPKRKGDGVALYIANTVQYKVRLDINIGGDTNLLLVEIEQIYLKAKYSVIIGCIYRSPVYSLKLLNEFYFVN